MYGFVPEGMSCNMTLDSNSQKTPSHDCFQGMCFCTTDLADCSGHGENLTSIPKLPPTIRYLNFSRNRVVDITKDFFKNVPQLTAVALSDCGIERIHPEAFKALKNLTVVILDHNGNLTNVTLSPVFEIKSLECVDVRYGTLTALPKVMFEENAMPKLKDIFLHANSIMVTNLTMFQKLSKLRTLAWGLNDVYLLLEDFLPELDTFDSFSNRLVEFPRTCAQDGQTSLFPRLSSLNLMKNKLDALPSRICLPSLTYLDLGGNYFPTLYTGMFRPQLFPRLEYLHMEYIGTRVGYIEKRAFANPTLRMVSLMYNDIDFSQKDLYHEDAFAGLPSVTALQLSHNFFTEVSDERFLRLFGHLSKLEALYMGDCGLQQISSRTFASFPKLGLLELYQNKVSEVPDGAFNKNPHLYELQLNENRIAKIGEATFSPELRSKFSWLDLSGNPFICDCDLRWFSDYLRTNHTPFRHSWTTYNCSNLEDKPVESFHVVAQACIWDQTIHKAIIAAVSIFIILLCLVAVLFHYRWLFKLKVRCYRCQIELMLKKKKKKKKKGSATHIFQISKENYLTFTKKIAS
jgi:Leucine-rich repeat (LRR) protein